MDEWNEQTIMPEFWDLGRVFLRSLRVELYFCPASG